MNTRPWFKLLILAGLVYGLAGCAHVISSEMRAEVRKDLSFTAVLADPEAHRGETVIWGGRVIDTLNQEGVTLIKVLQIPLDYTGMPGDEEKSEGRFMAEIKGYADPEVYRKGRLITVAGNIIGKRIEPLGEIEYAYPLIEVKEIYLWKQYPASYGPYPASYWFWFGSPYPYTWPYYWPYYGPHFLF